MADLNGPKWTSLDLNGPKWTILVHFGLANAKSQLGIRSFDQNGRLDHFGPVHFPTVPQSLPTNAPKIPSLGYVF